MNDFTIGSDPIDNSDACVLKFHQYPIYDRTWSSGYLYFDSVTGLISTSPGVTGPTGPSRDTGATGPTGPTGPSGP